MEASPAKPRGVSWGPDKDDNEKEGLLKGDGVPPTAPPAVPVAGEPGLTFGTLGGPPATNQSGLDPAAPIDFTSNRIPPSNEEMTRRPSDLQPLPEKYELWPAYPLKVACPACGMYTMTTLEEETECVGFTSLCSDGPLFRDITSHYCPRCRNRIGTHYTGRSCGRGAGCCHIQ